MKTILLKRINAKIKQNDKGEITAEVLNEILRDMLLYLDEKIGDFKDLDPYLYNAQNNDNTVEIANILQNQINDNKIGIHIGLSDPNQQPPESYATLDYYLQTDLNGETLYLWQYTEREWCKIDNYINDAAVSPASCWSSLYTQERLDVLQQRYNELQKQIDSLQEAVNKR